MRIQNILLTTALFIISTATRIQAQNSTTIYFNGKGNVKGTLPDAFYTNKDKINFKVDDPGQGFTDYKKQLTDKLSAAQARLKKLKADQTKLKVLKDVFGIEAGDIDTVIADLGSLPTHLTDSPIAAGHYSPVFGAGKQKYFLISTEHLTGATPMNFEPNTISATLPITLDDGSEFDFTLTKIDPLKKITFDWYAAKIKTYPERVDFSKFQTPTQQLRSLIVRATDFLDRIRPRLQSGKGSFDKSDMPFLTTVRDSAQKLANDINNLVQTIFPSIKQSDDLKVWMLNWLWYQSAIMPAVDPFPFKDPADLGDAPDTSSLPAIRIEINALEAIYQNTGIYKLGEPGLEKFIARDKTLRKQLDSIQRLVTKYNNDTAKNDKQELNFATTKTRLYEGIFFANDKQKQVYWMRHHDASRNYMLMNGTEVGEYLETDQVVILEHNLSASQKADIHISFADISNDQSKLAETLDPVVQKVTQAITGMATKPAVNKAQSDVDDMKTAADNAIRDLGSALLHTQELAPDLDYLVGQSNPNRSLEEKTDVSSTFHTETATPPRKTDGPKKATYYFNASTGAASGAGKSDAPATDTFSYRINKLYRIFPLGGYFYTTTAFATVSTDSTSKQNKISTNTHGTFVVGFKVYIQKTDIRNSDIFWKKDIHGRRLWPSRLSIAFAFDVSAPANNIYIGSGLDIWPGCTINVGATFNRYTYNMYNNGILTDSKKLYRPGLFVGISTDLSLFTDISKLLNLSK